MSNLAFKVRLDGSDTRSDRVGAHRNTTGQWTLEYEHQSYDTSRIEYAALFENKPDSQLFGWDFLGLDAANADSVSWGSRVTSRLKRLFAAT